MAYLTKPLITGHEAGLTASDILLPLAALAQLTDTEIVSAVRELAADYQQLRELFITGEVEQFEQLAEAKRHWQRGIFANPKQAHTQAALAVLLYSEAGLRQENGQLNWQARALEELVAHLLQQLVNWQAQTLEPQGAAQALALQEALRETTTQAVIAAFRIGLQSGEECSQGYHRWVFQRGDFLAGHNKAPTAPMLLKNWDAPLTNSVLKRRLCEILAKLTWDTFRSPASLFDDCAARATSSLLTAYQAGRLDALGRLEQQIDFDLLDQRERQRLPAQA